MLSRLDDLETRDVDTVGREELIGILLDFKDGARVRFTPDWVNRQPTERLRLLVLAVQLYRALEYQASQSGAANPRRYAR